MQNDQIEDLKQFIDEGFSNIDTRFDQLESKVESQLLELRGEMNERFDGVAEAIETLSGHVDERLTELEKAI